MESLTQKQTEQQLVAYADGDLSPAEARQVEQALEQYPEFRESLRAYRNSLQAVTDGFAPVPPTIAPRAAVITTRARRKRRGVHMAYSAATAGLLFLIATALLTRGQDEVVAPQPALAPPDMAALMARIEALETEIDDLRREQRYSFVSARSTTQAPAITTEEVAAILVAAARNLLENADDAAGARERFDRVIALYPNTRSATEAKRLLAKML
jgi:hypothetical protein